MRRVAVIAFAALLLAAASTTSAQLEDPNAAPAGSQTVFIDDEAEEMPPWRTVLEGSNAAAGGGGAHPQDGGEGEVADVEPRHIRDVESEGAEAPHPTGRASTQQHDSDANKRTGKDMDSYAAVIAGFETRLNDWCCAVTGKPLYTVSGDRDVANYMFFHLSQDFDNEGQQYGGRLVLNYHLSRTPEPNTCAMIEQGDEKAYAAPVEALLALREGLNAWLSGNEVDPAPIIGPFIANAKQMIGKFVRSRMLFAKMDGITIPALDLAVEATLPLVDANDLSEYCIAGGDYQSLAPDARGVAKHEIESMVESCVANGKLAENPTEFGDVLLEAGREKEARVLFELAVERGQLCNALQRPDGHLRKDIVARPVWPSAKLGGMTKAMDKLYALARQPAHAAAAKALLSDEAIWGGGGARPEEWGRFPIYARQGVNFTLCDTLGPKGCEAVADAARSIQSVNDGYEMACNSSLTIEFWAIRGGSKIPRSIGATNIVLQVLYPLAVPSGVLTVVVGEDTAQVQEGAASALVFDDSFETTYAIGGTEEDVNVFLHAQVCHPALHEKALDAPSNECATFDEDDE